MQKTQTGQDMKAGKYSEEQIIDFLKQAEGGLPVKELCRKVEFGIATFYKWRSKFRGIVVADAKYLRELEGENANLKKLLVEAHLAFIPSSASLGVNH
jgi:putative transposase